MSAIETRTITAAEIFGVTREVLINKAEIVSGEAVVPGKTYRLKIRWPSGAVRQAASMQCGAIRSEVMA